MNKEELGKLLVESYVAGIMHAIEFTKTMVIVLEKDLPNIAERFEKEFVSKLENK